MGSSNPLITTIQSLETGLEAFNKRATAAASVCETFEQRLKRLENDMKPLEGSQRLAIARKNLDLAMISIENVRKHFDYEANAKRWVRRGYEGAEERVIYIQQIHELREIEDYFRRWTTLESDISPLGRLVQLEQEAVETCLAEFRELVKGIGQPVYYLNRTGAYEVRNILSEESLRSTLLWLSSELPCSNEKMKEAYAEMRAKLSLQILADFNKRNQLLGWSGGEDRGDINTLLDVFLDLVVKYAIMEKLLLDRVFPDNSSKYAIEVILSHVTDNLRQIVQNLVRSTIKVADMTWERNAEVMVSMFKAMHRVTSCTRLVLPAIDKNDAVTEQFTSVLKEVAEALKQSCINFVNVIESDSEIKRSFLPSNAAVQAIISGTVNSIRRVMPFMGAYEEAFVDVPVPWHSDGDSAAYDESSSSEDIRFPRFARFIDHVFQRLVENLIKMRNPNLVGSEIVNLATQQISCVNNFCYLRERAHALSTTSPIDSGSFFPTSRWSGQNSILNLDSRMAKAVMILTDQYDLEKAVEVLHFNSSSPRTRRRSPSAVKSEALDILFEPKSASHHSCGSNGDDSRRNQNFNSTKGTETEFTIAEFIRPQTRRNIFLTLNSACETYRDIVLAPMAKTIEDDVTDLGQCRQSSPRELNNSQLSFRNCRKLKSKFSNWNELWEAFCTSQTAMTVLDSEIKEQIKDEIRECILMPYEALYNKYHDVQFSRRHQDQYMRFSPSDISSGIDAMFLASK